ncbi:hypothetical protein [Psychromonas ingrahamii]|uniref:hypothetical protein n=1 Tax=Psychromonas ingrahamii TaxID=357794 RepID=UPI0002FCC42D|nr:hypothetical protein [Psychromonas ingrahamii]
MTECINTEIFEAGSYWSINSKIITSARAELKFLAGEKKADSHHVKKKSIAVFLASKCQ